MSDIPQKTSDSIRNILKRLGLDEREREIYLALLPLKIARVSTIAKASKQPRTLAYVVLEKLEQKAIISRIEKNGAVHFVAESPERLLRYVREQQRELDATERLLEAALPQLNALKSPLAGTPRVTMFHGIEGMKEIYQDVLTQEFYGMLNMESMLATFKENIVTKLYGPNIQLKGKDLLVNNPSATQYINDIQQSDEYEIRLLPKNCQFNGDTMVYGDMIAMFAYDDEQTIIRIENQNLANAYRAWFNIIWNISKI
jgi:sugar-specific transcriptional regulator TrmB